MRGEFRAALEKAQREETLTKEEIVLLLAAQGDEVEALLAVAGAMTRKYVGDEVHIRGLVEFSNYCGKNCDYCGLRRGNKEAHRYRLSPAEIVEAAKEIEKSGIGTIVLQSGEDGWYSKEKMAEIIEAIKKETNLAVTLSIGERPPEEYRRWKEAGADRYLLKQEIVNPEIFTAIHPDDSLEERINCLRNLRELGYQVGSGFMIGLPGQTLEDIAEDILFLQNEGIEMAGIGPFIPHHQTPLAHLPAGDVDLTLKAVAVTRLVTKDALLPSTTATETLAPGEGQKRALQAGANVIMINMTPAIYRKDYQIYPGKVAVEWEKVKRIIAEQGKRIGQGVGHSFRYLRKKEGGI